MKIKSVLVITCMFLQSACIGLGGENGEFKTDEEMTEFLLENYEEFNVLVETEHLCNEAGEYEPSKEVPVYCKETIQKLELISTHYWSYNNVSDNGTFVERAKLTTYNLGRGLFNGYNKGYYYVNQNIDSSELWAPDLNTLPPKDTCENYFRLIKIEHESIENGWYIYLRIL